MSTDDSDRAPSHIYDDGDVHSAQEEPRRKLIYVFRADGTLLLWPPEAPLVPAQLRRLLATMDLGLDDVDYVLSDDDDRVVVYFLRDGLLAGARAVVMEV